MTQEKRLFDTFQVLNSACQVCETLAADKKTRFTASIEFEPSLFLSDRHISKYFQLGCTIFFFNRPVETQSREGETWKLLESTAVSTSQFARAEVVKVLATPGEDKYVSHDLVCST